METTTPVPLPLYQRPGFLLRRAHQISVGIFEEQCRPLGLTPPQYGALVLIDASPGSDQSSLARAMGFDKVTTLRLVRGLEEREYVHRALSTRDRRQHQLTLTDKGRALLQASAPLVNQAYQRLVSPLEDGELQELLRLLSKLESGLGASARVKLEPLHRPAAPALHAAHPAPLPATGTD
ncbi:Multidrug resistance operon repressor [Delftia tsuruhatensis]|uniref:MarR family winged helix-turn-helix transcriptional regulator n=1 Tax=Delftia tsuruhatensis TaxID=180282 RepID=UPI001E7DDD29|nr:MarR family transcriptional regulator [Delftia tsuruhatensis]CAB5706839.1 Multidrug resistance operon repressor [Delftia tsuruhatensis]CAC9684671.1 Multidrug resistance operon repressor [Delftia tsuruhatensis]